MDNNEEWHLSKSVPVTLVFAIAVQTAGFIWYMSSLDKSVETNAREIARQEVRLMTVEASVQTLQITMARIDENIKSIRVMMEKSRGQ
jgi:Tfp pilus assembly protein PilO